jgi:hypothetical protein
LWSRERRVNVVQGLRAHVGVVAAGEKVVGAARSDIAKYLRATYGDTLAVEIEKTMKVLLTGGSGDLGRTLVPRLLDRRDTPVILDVRPPRDLKQGAVFIEGSILDRPK